MIRIKRVYDKADKGDGYRILIDRLWPRGLSKGKAQIALWLKEAAPGTELRKWFSHDPEKWNEFRRKYESELKNKSGYIQEIKEIEKKEKLLTLLYSAKDEEYNNAVVLKDFLQKS